MLFGGGIHESILDVVFATSAYLVVVVLFRRIHRVRISPWTWALSVCQMPMLFALWLWLGRPESVWLVAAVSVLPALMLHRAARRDLRRTQEWRDRQAHEFATAVSAGRVSVPRFALYLRAFETTERLPSQPVGRDEHLDFESIAHSALWQEMPLIAAGRPGDIVGGAGRLVLADHGWQHAVAALADAAALVVLIPSANPGTLWEMNWLREHDKLDRTIFVMPESAHQSKPSFTVKQLFGVMLVQWRGSEGHYRDHARDWDAAVAAAATIGLELPPYRYEGAIFRLDRSGHVCSSRPLGLIWLRRRIRRVRRLLHDLRFPADPPAPVRTRFVQCRPARLRQVLVVSIGPALLVGILGLALEWVSGWWRIAVLCVLGLIAARWFLRAVTAFWTYGMVMVDETGISLRNSLDDAWHWPWSELAAVEITSAADQYLVGFPTHPPANPDERFWRHGRYFLVGLRRFGIEQHELAAALTRFSGGRYRESARRWTSPNEEEALPVPREYRMSTDDTSPPDSWPPAQMWLHERVVSRAGFGFVWLLAGGLALWGWYLWISLANGLWEVIALPLAAFGLYALLSGLPSALGGKRLLFSSAGLTFFPPGSSRPPVYLAWSQLGSVDVKTGGCQKLLAHPASATLRPKSDPSLRLWFDDRGRYEIGIGGIPAVDVRAALARFRCQDMTSFS